MLSTSEAAALDRDGYVVLTALIDSDRLQAIRAALDEALAAARNDTLWKAGGTLHLDDLSDEAPFSSVWQSARLLAAAAHIVGGPAYATRVHYRAPLPGFGAQALHADVPEPIEPGEEQAATAIVALTDFTEANGATRVVPASHLLPRVAVPPGPDTAFPDERIVACRAGDAIVFSAHLRHSGTRNRSEARRESLQISFGRAAGAGTCDTEPRSHGRYR